MYEVEVRAKGPQGSITLPVKKFRNEPTAAELRELVAKAYEVQYAVHSTSATRVTVDTRIKKVGR